MEFSDIWTIKPKTAGVFQNYVPYEVSDALRKFVQEHPFLDSGELSFREQYDYDDGYSPWDEDQVHGDFWVSPKTGYSFDESISAAPHVSHTGDIPSMLADIASLKPCGEKCYQPECNDVNTSGHTEQSIQAVTKALLDRHNIMPLLKTHGLDEILLPEERQRRINQLHRWQNLDEAEE